MDKRDEAGGVEVTWDDVGSRYLARLDGEQVGAAYVERDGKRVVFTHTEVDDAVEGRGIGSALARTALDDVRKRGLRAVPQCPFIAAWIDRHPDYRDLVA